MGVSVSTYVDSVTDNGETFSLVIDSVTSSASVGISNSSAMVTIDDSQASGTGGGAGGGAGGVTGGSGGSGGGTGGSGGTGGVAGGGTSGGSTGGTGGGMGGGGGGTGDPPVQNGPTITYRVDRLDDAVEGISQGRFKISRPLESTPAQTVYFRFASNSQAIMNNQDGTVTNADYVPSTFPYQIQFASGQWQSIIYIGAYADGVDEVPESVILDLLSYAAPGSGPVPYLLDLDNASATLTIQDPPLVTISNASITEGDVGNQNVTIPVALQFAVAVDISVQVKTTDGTALESNQDYVGGTKTVVIAAGQTQPTTPLTYQVKGDDKVEPDEKFTAKILSAGACRVDPANVAEITIQNDDYAPDLNGIGSTEFYYTWLEGQRISQPMTSVDNDTPAMNVAYTLSGAPSGLSIAPSAQGFVVSGRLTFLAHHNQPQYGYTMTVVATDPSGNSNTKTFRAYVGDSAFDSLDATEVHFYDFGLGTYKRTSNEVSATASNSPLDWTVSEDNWIETTAVKTTTYIESTDYRLVFETGAFATGTGTQMRRLTGASGLISLQLDLNLDGVFAASETTHAILVYKVDFSGATIKDQRVAGGPIESTAFEVIAGEHFETGGVFEFNLNGVTIYSPLLRHVYYRDTIGFSNTPVDGGPGASYTTTMTPEDASCKNGMVMYYYDVNDNGSYDSDEPKVESPWFSVADLRVIDLSIVVSGAIAAPPNQAALQAIWDAQAALALRRDGWADWRGRISFNVSLSVEPATAAHPDNIATQGEFDAWMGIKNDFVLVNGFHGVFDPNVIGKVDALGQRGGVIDWDDHQLDPAVWLHELGHQFGLRHDAHSNFQVMFNTTVAGVVQQELTKADAEAYETADRANRPGWSN